MNVFPAPANWRTIAPADCIGLPVISWQYSMELADLAGNEGILVEDGMTLSATYRRVDDEWHPVPGTLRTS